MSDGRRHGLGAALGGLALASLAGSTAMAGSQSSDSSSNCSAGRRTRVDTLVIEDDHGDMRGRRRTEAWNGRDRGDPRRGRDDA
ncbi:hypothetical protein GCM10010964_12570 [Caldovatus sediminis]|uniref:Uncharacterized protein n=1 Tax=Caldovatus sediminis TaxID=2041189 RepID=A0A8J2Z9U0_9PROT|nr:hypothetical protein [Caldovatus sediminis]GGG26119.1 hypothetical protein GCM10010964_12570 [Caldovatus sediminis]